MKKISYLILSIILVGATFFMSCNKSSSKSVTGPTIHFITGAGYISSDQTVQITTPLLFGINATAGDGKLNRLIAKRTFQGKTSTAKDSSFSAASFTYDFHTVAMGSPGNETWVFTIFDTNGGSSAVTLTITTTIPTSAGFILPYSNKLFVAQTSTYNQGRSANS